MEKRTIRMTKIIVDFTNEELLKLLCKAADIPYVTGSVEIGFKGNDDAWIAIGVTLRSTTEEDSTKGVDANVKNS